MFVVQVEPIKFGHISLCCGLEEICVCLKHICTHTHTQTERTRKVRLCICTVLDLYNVVSIYFYEQFLC